MSVLAMLLPAAIPAVLDVVKTLVYKITGISGAEPKTVDEAIKLKEAEISKLKAIAELDKPWGEVSKWVANLRASFRYLAAGLILIATIVYVFIPDSDATMKTALLEMSGSVFSFMFGDRLWFHIKEKK